MVEIRSADFPPFLEEEFAKMIIPGDGNGFAVSFSSESRKECVACGLLGNRAISMRYTGEEYAVKRRKPISTEVFAELCKAVPAVVKKSGFIFAADILDGETYLVKWSCGIEKTRLVLGNPRQIHDDDIRQLAGMLDDLMRKC